MAGMVSTRSKIVIASLAVVAATVYLVIVDLGISAGRIHRGVSVRGIDVGGLTVVEAARKLGPIGEDLADNPLLFTAPGVDCRFLPRDLGWGPQAFDTAETALQVGREGGPFAALWDRFRAWVSGIEIGWSDVPDSAKIDRFLNECDERVASVGVTLDRSEMRVRIRQAIGAWPYEQVYELPVAD